MRNCKWLISFILIIALCAGCAAPREVTSVPETSSPAAPYTHVTSPTAKATPSASPEVITPETKQARNIYDIAVQLDTQANTLTCAQQITYINDTGDTLSELYFHIYPNVYADINKAPIGGLDAYKTYPHGYSPSYTDITSVSIDSAVCGYELTGNRDDLMKVVLGSKLAANGKLTIDIRYTVKLPHSRGRLCYDEIGYTLTDFFPKLAVYADEAWDTRAFAGIGDAFYSEVDDYRVAITAPRVYTVASSGVITSETVDGSQKTTYISAPCVRDFAMEVSDKLKCAEQYEGEVRVLAYALDAQRAEALAETGALALRVFSEAFGKYPYACFSLVQSDIVFAGVEYPNIVFLCRDYFDDAGAERLEYTAVHETAHQWWYGIVGSDQIASPWLDEGFCEWSTLMYLRRAYGEQRYEDELRTMKSKWLSLAANRDDITRIDASLYEFVNEDEYIMQVYMLSTLMFCDIEDQAGRDDFLQACKNYYERFAFSNAAPKDFIDSVNESTGRNMKPVLEKWLKGRLPEA